MIPAQPTVDEASRVEALRRYAVLDTLPEQALDDLTALAAHICGAPMATISLVDADRQWFKARIGMPVAETPRDISFCGHAVQQRGLFVVPDAKLDGRFEDNPLVTGDPNIRFYAGAPLVSPDDAALGALCVMDHVPRTLTQSQEQALQVLARQVMTHLELRRHTKELSESEDRLKIVTDNARVGLVIVNQERRYVYANNAYAEILGLPTSAIIGKRLTDVLPEVYEEQIRSRLDRAFAGERVIYELHKPVAGGDCHYVVTYEPTPENSAVVVVITDVTADRQAGIAPLRLAAIVESSDDAIISKDLHSIVTSWNRGAEKIFGYTAAEMVGTSIMRLIPDDRQAEEEHILGKIRAGESVEHFETLRQTKDGRRINVSVTASPIKDATGKAIGVSKVARDITERKVTETALAESDELNRGVLNSVSAHIAVLNRDGIIVSVNDAWSHFAEQNSADGEGLQRRTGLGTNYLEICNTSQGTFSEEAMPVYDGLSRVLRGEQDNFMIEYPCHGAGVQRWFLMSATPLKTKNGGAVVSHLDISARKQAEEQVTEQAALLDKAQDAIIVREMDGGITFWNKGAEQMYGWTAQEALGRNLGEVLLGDPHLYLKINDRLIRDGDSIQEFEHFTKDKHNLTVEARMTLIRGNEGRAKSVLAIITDITEKKKIEAQFMRAQRMESIGTLAGGVAHDLNNILAPIMMSIEILKDISEQPQAKEILETIEISAKRGADIVRQVLSFARGLEGERIEVQPKHLLKDLENIIKDTFPKDIRLQFIVPNDIWTILGDPTQVHQILLNLCVNARDAMPNGGSLIVGVENCVLDEQYAAMNIQAKPGRYVLIGVTDSGMGIPSHLIDKIFEPFFTTKELHKGTGLGLSTVTAIVKSHEGVINVYSEPGKGTTFKVYLPAMDVSDNPRKEVAVQASLPRGNGETILVVDDEASILTITSQTLQAFGYKVLTAANGATAVAVYAQHQHKIAVVLTDMMMPVMDGPATVHALKEINPSVKIVAASGLNSNGGEAKVSGVGVNHFLTKPYTAGTLLKTIRAILDEK
jgi:PAS domain S-box-containing protein